MILATTTRRTVWLIIAVWASAVGCVAAGVEGGEEAGFGVQVILGIAVKVEVIAAEIGEDRRVPGHAVGAMLSQRV